jgi:hypothetical protein
VEQEEAPPPEVRVAVAGTNKELVVTEQQDKGMQEVLLELLIHMVAVVVAQAKQVAHITTQQTHVKVDKVFSQTSPEH